MEDGAVLEGQTTPLDLALEPSPSIFVWEPNRWPASAEAIGRYFENRRQAVVVSDRLKTFGPLAQFDKVFVCLGMTWVAHQIKPGGPEDLALTEYLEAGAGRLLYIEGGEAAQVEIRENA